MNRDKILSYAGIALLFVSTAAVLFLSPASSPLVFPAFGLAFLWAEWRGAKEARVILIFLTSLAGLFILSRLSQTPDRAAVALELAGLWLMVYGIGRFHDGAERRQEEASAELDRLGRERQEKQDRADFLRKRLEGIGREVDLRRGFAEAAHQLGATMDREEIRSRLMAILGRSFPNARARLDSGAPKDRIEEWVAGKKAAIRVDDIHADARFRDGVAGRTRSVMVAPLKVLKETVGFLRLDSETPGAFSAPDLRIIDLYSTLASLSMENVYLYEQVQTLAKQDGLTRLHTHRSFQVQLQEEVLRAGRTQSPFSLLMADVDHFKVCNDRYGHQAGDLVLQTVAGILSSNVRGIDFVARYGGEEFTLILPAVGREQAVEQAERIRRVVEQQVIPHQGQVIRITLSLGVSVFPEDATVASQLVRVADQRLYLAKQNGRNRVVGA
ncbi:MAG: sensor domain-containing diguanylate cyclase [Elusimicrobia bacterium]|nr:sensor domain-containing diguanylate cyclase [Elusimicrobiota bacterium]